MSWIGGAGQMPAGNPQVLPMERHQMLGKLYPSHHSNFSESIGCRQYFLVEYLGNAPDAAARAKDMAVKFEEHVFKTTKTKEDYLQTIQARMKFVQAKKGVPEASAAPLEHSEPIVHLEDSDKVAFLAKMDQFRSLIPRMDKLIEMHGRLGTNPEMIRKYAGYRNVIHRQLELLPSNTFIMPILVINNIFEQSSKMTVYLATKAKEMISSNPDLSGSSQQVSQQTRPRLSAEEILKKKFGSTSSEMMPTTGTDAFKQEPDYSLLQYEIDMLAQEGHSLSLRRTDESAVVIAHIGQKEVFFKVPPDYPSTSPFVLTSDAVADFDLHVLAPITLATSFRLFLKSLANKA